MGLLKVFDLDCTQVLEMDDHVSVLLVSLFKDLPCQFVLFVELLLGFVHEMFAFFWSRSSRISRVSSYCSSNFFWASSTKCSSSFISSAVFAALTRFLAASRSNRRAVKVLRSVLMAPSLLAASMKGLTNLWKASLIILCSLSPILFS